MGMMTKTKLLKMTEIKRVHYTERPRTICRLLNEGYTLDDIVIIRIDCCSYKIVAMKEI